MSTAEQWVSNLLAAVLQLLMKLVYALMWIATAIYAVSHCMQGIAQLLHDLGSNSKGHFAHATTALALHIAGTRYTALVLPGEPL
jgi:succinate dehydrogenase/fumarate reductase cytochrome b subunit